MENINTSDVEPKLCTLHSDDANRQAENLVNWDQEFDQLSRGRFLGVINEIHFPDVHVFREDTSHILKQQCRVEDGGVWIGFSADDKLCRINNMLPQGQQFLFRPGGEDFELLTPENFSIFGLVLHQSFLSEFEEQEGEFLKPRGNSQLWLESVSFADLMRFRQYFSLLLDPQGCHWSSKTQELILKDAVFDLLHQARNESPADISGNKQNQVMSRIKQYLTDSALHSPVTVNELCNAAHVSRRTLQNTFTHCCGMSPKQYILLTRLNQVRRALRNAEQEQSVTDIAFGYGFFHLSQFGQDYKRLFGETPKQTLTRR